ncbi:MAG: SPOR domain-containing protein, partial [Natronohydrobacter sp.]|nr:SPOR domain-containing protein [Natronohydrobacter sp.]
APTMIEVVALRVEDAQPAAAEAPAPEAAAEAAAPEMAAAPAARPAPTAEPVAPAPTEGDNLIALPEAQTASAPRREGGLFGRVFGRRSPQPAPNMASDGIATQVLDDAQAVPAASLAPDAAPAAPAAPAPAPAAAPASTLAQPYIQLGIFSVEANARNAERMATGAGLSARVVAGQASGNQFWRVVVGPASTQADQRQMLARVKGLGFNDAYAVRR